MLTSNVVNVGSLEIKYNPYLMFVAVNWSESVKSANWVNSNSLNKGSNQFLRNINRLLNRLSMSLTLGDMVI